MSFSIEADNIVHKLEMFSEKLDNQEDITKLNKKFKNISKLISTYLNKNLDDFFIIKPESVKEISIIDQRFGDLLKKLKEIQTSKNLSEKYLLLDEFDKIQKIIKKTIQTKDTKFLEMEQKEDRSFYLAYQKFCVDKRFWRSSLFKERINWEEIQKNPLSHPEWPLFSVAMKKYIEDESTIEKMWILTIKGLDSQINLLKQGKKFEEIPQFTELVKILNDHGLLALKAGEPMALWCGGFDLSLHAQNSHYSTLEETVAGRIFDLFILYSDFEPQESLWNHLSKGFIEKEEEKEVHIFFRVHDPLSTLDTQELRNTMMKEKKIIFHPIINKGDSIDELDFVELSLKRGENPKLALKNMLVRISQAAMKKDQIHKKLYKANSIAIEKMKID